MRTLDEIVSVAVAEKVQLRLNPETLSRAGTTSVDSLFHVPLLALTILVVARSRKNGLPTADLTTWTLATLVRHFDALRVARSGWHWSILLRRRCADGLVFLENVGLAVVRESPARTIQISVNGRDLLRKTSQRADELGALVRSLERAHRAVQQGGIELL